MRQFWSKVYSKYVLASDIGSGKYAMTTDESGQFWGKAGAGGVFYAKSTGRILLAYRSAYVNEPHTWGVWGGAIDQGENPVEAVKREIKEETGYRGKFDLEPVYVYKKDNFQYHNFLISVPEEFDPKLCWETEKYGWFHIDQFPSPLHFGLKELLPHLQAHLKSQALASYTDWSGEWVHYSDVNKIGVNPQQFHMDLAGVYLFPKEFKTSGTLWREKKYKFTVKISDNAKVLDLSKLSKNDLQEILDKLNIKPFPNHPLNADTFWDALKNYYCLQNKKNVGKWNSDFRRLGYDAIFDDTNSIHTGEVQIVVLNPKIIKIVDVETQSVKRGQFDRIKKVTDYLVSLLKPYGKIEVDIKKKRERYSTNMAVRSIITLSLGENNTFYWTITEDESNREIIVDLTNYRETAAYMRVKDNDFSKLKTLVDSTMSPFSKK